MATHQVIANPTAAELAHAQKLLTAYGATLNARFDRDGKQAKDGSWPGCFAVFETKPVSGGMEVWVYSAHAAVNEPLIMSLKLPVNVGSGNEFQELQVALAPETVVVDNPTASGRYIGVQKFLVKDADVNAYLTKYAPQAKQVRLETGTNVLVDARWPSGHHWGGLDRDGRLKYVTAESVAQPTQVSTELGEFVPDCDVPYDTVLRSQYPVLSISSGGYQSHIESEFKTRLPPGKFKQVYETMLALAMPKTDQDTASQQALLTKIFGKDAANWKVKAVDEYWQKDEKGAYKTDAGGFALVKMFDDLYYDTADRALAKNRLAVRMRQVTGQTTDGDWLNVKLWEKPEFNADGSPKVRPGNVNNRVEIAMPTRRGTRDNIGILRPLFANKDEPVNPLNRIREAYPDVQVMEAGKPETDLHPAMQQVARRYKFDLESKDGLSIELSLDMVMGMALGPDGMPLYVDDDGKVDPKGKHLAIAVYGQIEGELNHMNLPGTQSAASNAALWGRGNAGETKAPERIAPNPETPAGQAKWLSDLPPYVRTSNKARVHTVKDASHPGLLSKPDYKQFVSIMTKFQEAVLGKVGDPKGAIATEQKAAMGALLNGLVPMTPAQEKLYADEKQLSVELRSALGPVVAQARLDAAGVLERGEKQAQQDFKTFCSNALDSYNGSVRWAYQYYQNKLKEAAWLEQRHRILSRNVNAPPPPEAIAMRKDAATSYNDNVADARRYYDSSIRSLREQFYAMRARSQVDARAVFVDALKGYNPLSLPLVSKAK